MKKQLLTLTAILLLISAFGQVPDTVKNIDKKIKDQVLSDINVSLETKSKSIDATVATLDKRADELDKAIVASKSANEKADKLLERVQSLETRQTTLEENELNVFQANFQSATINLVSMEREIKPLILFNSTKEFFSLLTETSNPMSYQGYQDWYKKFYKYIEDEKGNEASLNVLSSMIRLTGDWTKEAPFAGPIANELFSGIAAFINTLGRKKKDIRIESEKMFLLTAKVSQFTHDRNLIETEWSSITKELQELEKHYDKILKANLKLLTTDTTEFRNRFTKENDANNRYNYLTTLKEISSKVVSGQKQTNQKNWKEVIYYQLMDVQSLKIRFGTIAFKISENIARYKNLIIKYKNDTHIGPRVVSLESKLTNLKETFDRAFEPMEYINSATRMYKVN